MPTRRVNSGKEPPAHQARPASSPEDRENQLVSLAYDLAERQLREGTASSQVISHYLKMGSERERLERKRIEGENALLEAKIESLASSKRIEELYESAIRAVRTYQGDFSEEETNFDD